MKKIIISTALVLAVLSVLAAGWSLLWNASAEQFRLAHRSITDAGLVYMNRGNEHYAKGAYELAIAEYERSLKMFPDLSTAKYNLSLARKMADLEKRPHDDDTNRHLFIKYIENGDLNNARSCALELSDPGERDRCVETVNDLERLRQSRPAAENAVVTPRK